MWVGFLLERFSGVSIWELGLMGIWVFCCCADGGGLLCEQEHGGEDERGSAQAATGGSAPGARVSRQQDVGDAARGELASFDIVRVLGREPPRAAAAVLLHGQAALEPAARRPQHREPQQDGRQPRRLPQLLRRGIQPRAQPQLVRGRNLPLSLPPAPERVHHGDGGAGPQAHREGHGQARDARIVLLLVPHFRTQLLVPLLALHQQLLFHLLAVCCPPR
jgi:hypothetical protein